MNLQHPSAFLVLEEKGVKVEGCVRPALADIGVTFRLPPCARLCDICVMM